jgi:hypothetical protein
LPEFLHRSAVQRLIDHRGDDQCHRPPEFMFIDAASDGSRG